MAASAGPKSRFPWLKTPAVPSVGQSNRTTSIPIVTTLAANVVGELRVESSGSVEESVRLVLEGIAQLAKMVKGPAARVLGVGIGVPGLMDHAGRLVFEPNLGWRDIDVRALLERGVRLPVYVGNDTKAAALAGTWFGSSPGVKDFMLGLAIPVSGEACTWAGSFTGVHMATPVRSGM